MIKVMNEDIELTNDEFYDAWKSLSFDEAPKYTDTSDKSHRWLRKKVIIDFGNDSDIYPRKQTLYVVNVDFPYINLSKSVNDTGNVIRINTDKDYDIYKQIKNQLDN